MTGEEKIRWVLRFFRRVGGAGCWEFQGAKRHPYGYKKFSGKQAHRVMWELVYGPIPAGLFVLHHCDNPACVRPDHLFLGTIADNARDMRQKGRHPGKPGITACPRGHPYAPGNLIKRKNRPNHRECLTCHRDRMRKSNRKRREGQ